MRLPGLTWRLLFLSAACWACAAPGLAQEPVPSPQSPDVVRVNTSLVQTDVMVFDKSGSFVDGLKREQFVLKVDGKPRDISFFERIVAGSRNEEAQLAAARGGGAGKSGVVPLDRGRTVFFFVDDLHLSLGSNKQTRMMLQRFIDNDMGQNDEVAITSSSGQIGFLQQLTDDKRVLKAATARLLGRSYTLQDTQRPPMSEYQAQLIESGNDDVLTYFVDEVIRLNQGFAIIPRNMVAAEIQGRASQISQQTNFLASSTLNSLKALVKNAAALPGRKIVFVISDGFLLDAKNGDSNDRLRQVTAAAAASGVIIYSIDARGLTSGLPDASREQPFDPSGRLVRAAGGELAASQDGLHALATDTGGRAFLNSNNLSVGVTRALKETSAYYLLAWRPEGDEQRNQKPRRVEVSVTGRPDLAIRFHRAFGDTSPAETASPKKKEGETAATAPPRSLIGDTLRSPFPKRDLPVSISLNFLDLPQLGSTLTTSIKVLTNSMVLEAQEGEQVAVLDVAGGVYDDQGKPVSSFNKHLTIRSKGGAKTPPPDSVYYSHFTTIKPGLYQVRIAAVDVKQRRAGSAVGWIEIPDLGSKNLNLSTLIVGEKRIDPLLLQPSTADGTEPAKSPEALRQVFLNVDHRFAGSSHLRFVTFVYNARSSAGAAATPLPAGQGTSDPGARLPASSTDGPGNGPDLAVQVQLFRDNEPIITMPLHKIQIDRVADLQRLPYAAEVNLEGLPPGRYLLLVTVIDRAAKASASQKFGFQVD